MKRRFSFFPRAFLYFFPLHLGAEMITAMGLINKASGFYGILSIFTGHPLDAMEWVLNITSLLLLPIYAMAFWTVTHRNGFRMVLFAYIYTIDTFVCSISFSIYFIVHWFTAKAKEMAANGESPAAAFTALAEAASSAAGSIAVAAGTAVPADAIPTAAVLSEFAAATISPTATAPLEAAATQIIDDYFKRQASEVSTAVAAEATKAAALSINKSASLAQETAVSIVIVVALMLVRLYFTLCILSYARLLARQQNLRPHNGTPKGSYRAKLQYYALSFCETFWTGYGSGVASAYNSGSSLGGSSTSSRSTSRGSSRSSSASMSNKEEVSARLNQDFDE